MEPPFALVTAQAVSRYYLVDLVRELHEQAASIWEQHNEPQPFVEERHQRDTDQRVGASKRAQRDVLAPEQDAVHVALLYPVRSATSFCFIPHQSLIISGPKSGETYRRCVVQPICQRAPPNGSPFGLDQS